MLPTPTCCKRSCLTPGVCRSTQHSGPLMPLWISWFRRAGFVSDTPQPAPSEPLKIYRGCGYRWVRRMSWTTSLACAYWFAHRFDSPRHGIYQALITPAGVLGMFNARGKPGDSHAKSEPEVVVDPGFLMSVRRLRLWSSLDPDCQTCGGRAQTLLSPIANECAAARQRAKEVQSSIPVEEIKALFKPSP